MSSRATPSGRYAKASSARLGNPKLDIYRRDMDKARTEIEQADEAIYKQKRVINDLQNLNESLESENQRIKKQKLKLQTEVDQLNAIFDAEKNEIAELQLKVKRQNQMIKDEKMLRSEIDEDNRDLKKTIRQIELKVENLQRNNSGLEKQTTELENIRKTLLSQLDTVTESRNTAKSLYLDMEEQKCALDAHLKDAENAIAELEAQCDTAENNFRNMQGAYHTQKDQYAKDVARLDEIVDDQKRKFDNLERTSNMLLGEERKKKEQLVAAKKGLESQLENLKSDFDQAMTRVEEQLTLITRLENQLDHLKAVESELEAANTEVESLSRSLRESEKKVKTKDIEIENLLATAQQQDRARRMADEEAIATLEEAEKAKAVVMQARAEEKRNLDLKIAELEADLTEERVVREDMEFRCEKLVKDNKDLAENYAREVDQRKQVEVLRNRLDKQKEDLESELSRMDATLKAKLKETTDTYERKIKQLESTIEADIKERELLNKDLRKVEKQLEETSFRLEDAEESEAAFKTQLDKVTKKNDNLGRELAVKEDDLLRLQQLKIQLEGELDDERDNCASAKREITRLSGSVAGTRAASRMEVVEEYETLED